MTNCAVCFGKRLMKHDLCEVITLELITPRQKYKIPSWTDDRITNIPMNVHTQRYKRLKDDRLRCMFLKRLMKHGFWKDNVRSNSLRNYTIFQFGLQIQLAIISTQKPNTKTHMTYRRLIALCVLINGSRSMDFTKSCRSSSYPKKIANFQVALLIQQTIFHTKSKY